MLSNTIRRMQDQKTALSTKVWFILFKTSTVQQSKCLRCSLLAAIPSMMSLLSSLTRIPCSTDISINASRFSCVIVLRRRLLILFRAEKDRSHVWVPFVKILYLTDLAQKVLSLRIYSYLCTDSLSLRRDSYLFL